jgi:hypothetical protein
MLFGDDRKNPVNLRDEKVSRNTEAIVEFALK